MGGRSEGRVMWGGGGEGGVRSGEEERGVADWVEGAWQMGEGCNRLG